MTTLSLTGNRQQVQPALDIPGLAHREAGKLAAEEAKRVLALIESLAGGTFRFGTGRQPDLTVELDLVTFNRLASGRLPAEAALTRAPTGGDREVAVWFLNRCDVPY